MSTLCMKNENVQKYLGLPGRLWQLFCKLSVEHEFCYLFKKEDDFEVGHIISNLVFVEEFIFSLLLFQFYATNFDLLIRIQFIFCN